MLVRHEREKLVNAILFFCTHTRYCGKTKLFKLLYFLDFEHFKRTGRSVTGSEYYAWPKGPVPKKLYDEVPDKVKKDLDDKVNIVVKPIRGDSHYCKFLPKGEFNEKLFSKRELTIMKQLANEYVNSKADDMVEATHLENLPWHQVYNVERKKQGHIPYEYAVRKDESEFLGYIRKENEEILSNYTG